MSSHAVQLRRFNHLGPEANPKIGESETIARYVRTAEVVLGDVAEAMQKIDADKGLNEHGREELKKNHLSQGTPAKAVGVLRESGSDIEKSKADVGRQRSTLTSAEVLFKDLEGAPDVFAKRESILRSLYDVDGMERQMILLRAVDRGDALTLSGFVANHLETVFGPLVSEEVLNDAVEKFSRKKYPELWQKVDRRAAEVSLLEYNHEQTRQAFQRITGQPLEPSEVEVRPLDAA